MHSANLLPEFNTLLREANETLEEVDKYDLDSKDAGSVAKWKQLNNAHSEAASRLIAFVKNNPSVLTQVLSLTQ